jgi:hypothetical protein
MIVFPYLCGLIELPNFKRFITMSSMLYDPYLNPAVDIEQLAAECNQAVKGMQNMHKPETPGPVWDCAAGHWLPASSSEECG